ncbi:MAG: Txe/YoeB family addiction module toxin [Alphaproteobacteria bacterium]|nr:Txe/YoeB family addiction module toxin [Alphaproteobacteria bacterium]
MVSWAIVHSKRSLKDFEKVSKSDLKLKVRALLDILLENPYQNPPPYEKLVGELQNLYSRRINIQHRLIYEVKEAEKIIKVMSMWSHYE